METEKETEKEKERGQGIAVWNENSIFFARNYKYFVAAAQIKIPVQYSVNIYDLKMSSFLLLPLQMVATDEQTNERQQHATDSGGGASNTGALNKMKATLSSSLLTVTDKGKWMC